MTATHGPGPRRRDRRTPHRSNRLLVDHQQLVADHIPSARRHRAHRPLTDHPYQVTNLHPGASLGPEPGRKNRVRSNRTRQHRHGGARSC